MRKRRNITIETRSQEDASFEVDMSPMLSLMVTLIPIMLLSTVFVRITLIETPLPQVVQKAIEEDRSKKEKEINFVLNMTVQGFKWEVLIDGKVDKTTRVPKLNNQWDLKKLYALAHEIKMTHPQIFKIDLKPDSQIKYEDIVKVMDELRNIKKGDTKAVVTDSITQLKSETDLMFPEINFSNVVEG